jgi:hypothetical protein
VYERKLVLDTCQNRKLFWNLSKVREYYVLTSAVTDSTGKLVGSLSPQRPGFVPRPVYVAFVVDKVTLRQVFLQVLVFPCQYRSAVDLHTHISRGGWKVGPLVTAVQRRSLMPSTWTATRTDHTCAINIFIWLHISVISWFIFSGFIKEHSQLTLWNRVLL